MTMILKGISILYQSVFSGTRRRKRDDEPRKEKNCSSRLFQVLHISKASKRKRRSISLLRVTAMTAHEIICTDLIDTCNTMEVQQLSNLDLCTLSIGNPGVRYLSDHLSSNRYVTSINLKYSYIGDEGAISLAYALSFRKDAPPMEVLNLTGNCISILGSEALGIMLQQHPVRELCLSNNAIGDAGFELLSVGLSNVEKLQLNGIQLSDVGLVKCAHTLKHCSAIGIADNQCGASGITSLVISSSRYAPGQTIAMALLTSLVLSRNNIADAGCISLGRELDVMSISHLDLSHCGIGDDGAASIAKGVEHSSHIEFLSMHSNSIGDTGCTALADALSENETLKVLKLWRNNIGDAGAVCIGRALGSNRALKSLQLSFNRISAQGAAGLSSGLRRNNTLENLNLEFNKIGAAGANSLLRAMKYNMTLVNLKLYPEYHVSKQMKQLLNGNKKSKQMWEENLGVCNAIYV